MRETKEILTDLYELDPELKKYEEQVMKIIEKFQASRPQSKPDEAYIRSLRQEIMAEIEKIKAGAEEAPAYSPWVARFGFALGGAALTLVLALPLLLPGKDGPASQEKLADQLAYSPEISTLAPGAFGDFSAMPSSPGAGGEETAALDTMSMGGKVLGLGGGGAAVSTQSVDARMIAPEMVNFKYVYTGEDFSLPGERAKVYKRQARGLNSGTAIAGTLNLQGLVDLAKFRSLSADSFNLIEDREFGLSLFANNREGTVNVGTNWQKWPRPDANCRDEACFESFRLKMEDVPGDAEILAIAAKFVSDYNVNLGNYGEAQVDHSWRNQGIGIMEQRDIYVPEEMTVVYPLVLEGQEVADEGGRPYGIRIGVNIRYNRVSSAGNLNLSDYQASEYGLVTDKERVMELAQAGGLYPSYGYPEAERELTVNLGTPQQKLISFWYYNQETQLSEEYYIPALIFPVEDMSEQTPYFYRQSIVVPLVEEFIAMRMGEGIVEPMPLLREGQGGDVRIMEESVEDKPLSLPEEQAPATEPELEVMAEDAAIN